MTALADPHSASVIATLAHDLFDPCRTMPVLTVTVSTETHQPRVDVDELRELVGGGIRVELLPTVESAWELTRHLPAGYEIWGGAIRLWLPGATVHDDPARHPMFLVRADHDPQVEIALIARALSEYGWAHQPVPEVQPHADQQADQAADKRTGQIGRPVLLAPATEVIRVNQVARVDRLDSSPSVAHLGATATEAPGSDAVSPGSSRPGGNPTSPTSPTSWHSDQLARELEAATRRADDAEALVTDLRRTIRRLSSELEASLASAAAAAEPVYADPAQQLRHEVRLRWLRVVAEPFRNVRPLRNYHIGPGLVPSLSQLAVDREQLLTTIVRVLTYDAYKEKSPGAGRVAHQLHTGTGAARRPVTRPTGEVAWSCVLQVEPATLHLLWWERPDGSVELDQVTDQVTRPGAPNPNVSDPDALIAPIDTRAAGQQPLRNTEES